MKLLPAALEAFKAIAEATVYDEILVVAERSYDGKKLKKGERPLVKMKVLLCRGGEPWIEFPAQGPFEDGDSLIVSGVKVTVPMILESML